MMLDFLCNFGKLKRVPRTGWILRGIHKSEVESVADHTSRVVLLSLLVSRLTGEKLDTAKTLAMATLHDLSEALLFDIDRDIARLIGEDFKKDAERAVELHLLKDLPASVSREFELLLSEYHEGKSRESQIVKFCDRLETILQALEYEKSGAPRESIRDMYSDLEGLSDLGAGEPLKQMLESLRKRAGRAT